MQKTPSLSNSNKIYNNQSFSSRESPPPPPHPPQSNYPSLKRDYSSAFFSPLMGTPVPTYSNPLPLKKNFLKINSRSSQLSIGIANIERGIKYFYQNLLKLINEELKFFTSLNVQQGSTADQKLRYIKNIINKLNEIKLRIEADQTIFAFLMDNKNVKDKKSYIETLNKMDPKIFYKDFVNILNFYISILMKQGKDSKDSEDNLTYQHYSDFLTQYYESVLQKHNYGENYIQDFLDRGIIYRDYPDNNFINKSLEFIKINYKTDVSSSYYNNLYDPKFTHPKSTGGRRNKSIYTDMKMKDIKELCKANQIKLSTTVNDKRIIHTKKELITKLKRKKII